MSIRTLAWLAVVTILFRPLAMTQSSGPDGVAACGDQLVVPVTIVDKESSVLMHDLTPRGFSYSDKWTRDISGGSDLAHRTPSVCALD